MVRVLTIHTIPIVVGLLIHHLGYGCERHYKRILKDYCPQHTNLVLCNSASHLIFWIHPESATVIIVWSPGRGQSLPVNVATDNPHHIQNLVQS